MNRDRIEAEVRRLSPWYCRFELGGVATDITEPCDDHGHRQVRLPDVARVALVGRTVLDVGCNEGGYTFAALDFGAQRVTGFDVRSVNVEKARFVASVRGEDNVEFHVASPDEWLARSKETVDYVFLCGLLSRLPDPAGTIAGFCRLANRGVFVTCVLAGGDDGYTLLPEAEGIAASADPDEISKMPNTSRTIIKEFAPNGFAPLFVAENRTRTQDGFWGGCSLLFKRCAPYEQAEGDDFIPEVDPGVELHVIVEDLPPHRGLVELAISLYNWDEDEIEVDGEFWVEDDAGNSIIAPTQSTVRLPGRVAAQDGSSSESMFVPVSFEAPACDTVVVHALVRNHATGQPITRRTVRVRLASQ